LNSTFQVFYYFKKKILIAESLTCVVGEEIRKSLNSIQQKECANIQFHCKETQTLVSRMLWKRDRKIELACMVDPPGVVPFLESLHC